MFLNQRSELSSYNIGDFSYAGPDFQVLTWGEGTTLHIGKFCSIANEVKIFLGGEHRTDWVTTYPFNQIFKEAAHIKGHPKSKGDVHIGHDVWIGYGATIMSGVCIGNGAVIGANSVITKDVPPYAIAAGNPQQLMKYRFSSEIIEKLQLLEWWNLEFSIIQSIFHLLQSHDIERCITVIEDIKKKG
ncbi:MULTISPECIES: CatB-related O-acetyltransferase [Bacillus]|uniref:CatB-related O-acetyltransferase n=1 Tax=Bacillus TaxID=1386 RepID=UPI0003FC6EC6|nr:MULTISPECIES: CatB-related O-acetyltransferase [Bacillus]PNU24590.1 antibiotic acetyltransferase [Bacillus stratosphericus]QSI99781.1 CatB-related O-acetyltransferase [Bacillus sp. 3a]UIN48522.1 CatB-related O-acetyltransferase [Bacillus safensis]